jgi:hypothetical protein
VIWALLAIFAGVSMFVLKHQVRTLEGDLQHLERAIVAEQESIHVMAAEWSYLNHPARLDELGRRLIELVPATAAQQTNFTGLRRALEAPIPNSAPDRRPTNGLRVDAAARSGD